MSEDDCKALFSKFEILCKAYKDEVPEDRVKQKKQKQAAWLELVKEFIKVEMKDPLELLNIYMRVPNPLLEAKLEIFKSKSGSFQASGQEKIMMW
jgi:hypothetical protein